MIVGMKEELSVPEEKEKKKFKWRGDKLQLVQEVRMMPAEGMRAISTAFSQYTHT